MIVEKEHIIDLFDVDFNSKMTLRAIARQFQCLATGHSNQVGAGHQVLLQRNCVWYLHRLRIEVINRPVLHQKVRMFTWTRGMQRIKNFREYRITSPEGDDLVRGESVWLFYDLARKRIATIPEDIAARYENEPRTFFDDALDDWQPGGRINPDVENKIYLRYSDFDVNAHVNNTEYVGFFESLWHASGQAELSDIRELRLCFNREVDMSRTVVRIGLEQQGSIWCGNVFDGDTLFCDARIISGKEASAPFQP